MPHHATGRGIPPGLATVYAVLFTYTAGTFLAVTVYWLLARMG